MKDQQRMNLSRFSQMQSTYIHPSSSAHHHQPTKQSGRRFLGKLFRRKTSEQSTSSVETGYATDDSSSDCLRRPVTTTTTTTTKKSSLHDLLDDDVIDPALEQHMQLQSTKILSDVSIPTLWAEICAAQQPNDRPRLAGRQVAVVRPKESRRAGRDPDAPHVSDM